MRGSDRIYTRRRVALVEELREKGIRNERVLKAIGRVAREKFIEPGLRDFAYEDKALPIGLKQTISQPYTVAYQTELLDPQAGESVLEIGTGSGYQAAVLCEMGVRVYTIERHRALSARSQKLLKALGYRAFLRIGDGAMGWENCAPFDGVLVTCGALEMPEALLSQLKDPGGRLIIPLGDRRGQTMTRWDRTGPDEYQKSESGMFRFVPLISERKVKQ